MNYGTYNSTEPPPNENENPNPDNQGGLTFYGTPSDDMIVGTEFADRLYGGFGRDAIHGGAGDDVIGGGRDRDILTGGEGSDTFVFASNGSRDRVTDFESGEDLLNVRRLGIEFEDVNQSINARGQTVVTFDGFSGSEAPRIVLDDVGLLQASDFLF